MRRSLIAASALVILFSGAVPRAFVLASDGVTPQNGKIAVQFKDEQRSADIAAFEAKYGLVVIQPIQDPTLMAFMATAPAGNILPRIQQDASVSAAAEGTYARREQVGPSVSGSTSAV